LVDSDENARISSSASSRFEELQQPKNGVHNAWSHCQGCNCSRQQQHYEENLQQQQQQQQSQQQLFQLYQPQPQAKSEQKEQQRFRLRGFDAFLSSILNFMDF